MDPFCSIALLLHCRRSNHNGCVISPQDRLFSHPTLRFKCSNRKAANISREPRRGTGASIPLQLQGKRRKPKGSQTVPLVEDLGKEQPRRGRRTPCGKFRGVGQHPFDLGGGKGSPARLDEDARKPADHLPEEVGTDNPEDDQIPPGFEIRPVDLHLRGEVLVDPLVGE